MRYLLDTNIWIFYLKHSSSPLVTRLQQTPAKEIAVCSIVRGSMARGNTKLAAVASGERRGREPHDRYANPLCGGARQAPYDRFV